MKTKNIFLVFLILWMYSCTAQKNILLTKKHRIVNTENKTDIIISDITGGAILPFYLMFEKSIEENTHFLDLSPQSTSLMDLRFKNNKRIYFYNDNDEMKVECKCRMLNNYYLKNLKFKKGDYTLKFKNATKIKGEKIKVSKNIQNILFENLRTKYNKTPKMYFKDLEFTVIDMADTLNVTLEKKTKNIRR